MSALSCRVEIKQVPTDIGRANGKYVSIGSGLTTEGLRLFLEATVVNRLAMPVGVTRESITIDTWSE